MKKIILIAGYVAGGKTVFSQKLAEQLNLAVFNKDNMKAVLGNDIPIENREDSKRLSLATFGMMLHIAENLMKIGDCFILESNFTESEGEYLKELSQRYDYQALTYVFIGEMQVIHRRFLDRDNSPEREEANRSHGLFDDFETFRNGVLPLGKFSVGEKIIRVDTTDFQSVDFDSLIQQAQTFLLV